MKELTIKQPTIKHLAESALRKELEKCIDGDIAAPVRAEILSRIVDLAIRDDAFSYNQARYTVRSTLELDKESWERLVVRVATVIKANPKANHLELAALVTGEAIGIGEDGAF